MNLKERLRRLDERVTVRFWPPGRPPGPARGHLRVQLALAALVTVSASIAFSWSLAADWDWRSDGSQVLAVVLALAGLPFAWQVGECLAELRRRRRPDVESPR